MTNLNKHGKLFIGENLWVLKIILSLTAVILNVVYCVPVMSALSEYDFSFIPDETPLIMNYDSPSKDNESGNTTAEKSTLSDTDNSATEETTEKMQSETEESTVTEYVYETPEDIKTLESNYLAAFKSVEPAGSVEEVFFRTSGATNTVQGIAIRNATATKSPDFEALLNAGPKLSISDYGEPTVLIFHTHTTESYLLSDNGVFYEDYETRSTDSARNMIRIGNEICKVLESNGIGYIHDTNIYDESYEGAYARSRVTVEKYLEEYPSICIVLDIHRDAIYYSDTSHGKPTAEIEGKKAAQIMIITGAEEGYITDFPYWEDNLRFALCLQKTAEDKYPGLMKPVYFCQRKYNMDTCGCSLLLEIGTDANTLDEAMYSGYLMGQILTDIIKTYCEE